MKYPNKNIEQFMSKIVDDKNFAQEILKIEEPSGIQDLAKSVNISLSIEDVVSSKDIIKEELEKYQISEEEGVDVITETAIAVALIAATATVGAATIGATAVTTSAVISLIGTTISTWKW